MFGVRLDISSGRRTEVVISIENATTDSTFEVKMASQTFHLTASCVECQRLYELLINLITPVWLSKTIIFRILLSYDVMKIIV